MAVAAGPDSSGLRPRVLVTGFGAFPGAPDNPSAWLARALADLPAGIGPVALHTEVLPVEYRALPQHLAALGRSFDPDIAIHFGLSARARGFTLERLARNRLNADKPDSAGHCPPATPIVEGGEDLPSRLPLAHLEDRLTAAGLPASMSDDAGGYVCNYVFYLAAAGAVPHFAPPMTGFVHVPPLGREGERADNAMAPETMLEGARIILAACIESRRAERTPRA